MSDRMRGSVRTSSRDDDGAPAGSREGGPTGGDAAATTVAAGGPPKGAATPPERPAATVRPSASPPEVDGTQVITPASPPSGVFAAASTAPVAPSGAPAPGGPARSAPPASPLVPPAGAPPAKPHPIGRSAGTRGPVPGAPVGVDVTQAVPLAAPASQPTGPAGRPHEGVTRTPAAPAAKERGRGRAAGRGPRRARLQLRHIDTWSALKISLVVSIAMFFVWMVAVGLLYGVLNGLGVFQTLNDLFGQLGTSPSAGGGGSKVITAGVVFGGAAVIGAINVVLFTALCTVATAIYNLCSGLVGGLEVTLAERD